MYLQIILLILFICACCTVYYNSKKEHFWFIPQSMHLEKNDGLSNVCSNLGRHDCKRTAECGYCTLPNGDSQCVPGDWNGSINGQQCTEYEYGTNYASLSLVDPKQPYWVTPQESWNWTKPIYSQHIDVPIPSNEGEMYFRHGTPPQEHVKKLNI